MLNETGALTACGLTLAAIIWISRRFNSSRSLIELIPGPKCTSWVYGNMPQLLLPVRYGEHEFQWQETYGQVYLIKGCFGESRLMVSDPSAVKFITNSGIFAIGPSLQKIRNALFGSGSIASARGDAHRHLRNIMNPSFSASNIRALLPVVKDTARALAERWEALGFPGNTVDISGTLHDAALDVMGNAVLDHPFNALGGHSELARVQRSIMDAVSNPTKSAQLVDAALPYVPDFILNLAWRLPGIQMIKQYNKMTDELATHLAVQKREAAITQGFIGAFTNYKVTDKEIGDQLRTIIIAGQDTTGSTMGWILYKLAQMPDYQRDLREEIRLSKLENQPDYDNMPLLNAIINEVLRMYCAFPLAERVATKDCIIPLSQPITITAGAQISEIPIKKGQCLYVAISAYHRLRSIWGPDAEEFRPSRWLEQEPPCKGPALGPHASLLTFYGGPGVCLGWRLVILELQVIIAEIIGKFILSLPENDSVRACLAVTLVAETADGTRQIPVHVEAVA